MKRIVILLLFALGINISAYSQCTDNTCECVYSLAINEDTLWIGTKVGLFKYDIQTGTKVLYNKDNSQLPNNFVNAIKIGKDNSLWIGTYGGGLANLKNNEWTLFNNKNCPIASNNIFGIDILNDTVLWLASDKGVITYDLHTWELYDKSNSSLTYSLVYSVENEGDSVMWISANGGLSKFNSSWHQYNRENSGLPHNIVYSVTAVGHVKYVCTNGGLSRFDGNTWETMLPNYTHVFRYESTDKYWVGTSSGLKYFSDIWTTYLNNIDIQTIEIDKYNTKWIGTWGSGVYRFDNGTLSKLDISMDLKTAEIVDNVSIYPNPAKDFINIDVYDTSSPKTVEIYNLCGELIKSKKFNPSENQFIFDIRNLDPEIYLLKIKFGERLISKKFIVE